VRGGGDVLVLLWLLLVAVGIAGTRAAYLYGKVRGREEAERDLAETLEPIVEKVRQAVSS
jgi:hypothetical protein